jgi:hypothetical protein
VGWTTEELGFDFQQWKEIFSSPQYPYQLWDSQNLLFFPVEKRPGREADHSLPSSTEAEIYLHFPIHHHGVVLN